MTDILNEDAARRNAVWVPVAGWTVGEPDEYGIVQVILEDDTCDEFAIGMRLVDELRPRQLPLDPSLADLDEFEIGGTEECS